MLAKITSKNQLTLPKAVTQAVGPGEYFEVEARDGQIVLTPVRIQRADAVRAKLATRSERGIQKYCCTTARTDLSHVQWLQHAQEEAMDLAIYLERLISDSNASVTDAAKPRTVDAVLDSES
jgi:DNA-directed RNA polymerase subunit N (RpoN/RPB10)